MESRFLDIEGLRIRVVTHGQPQGSPVLLLHGGICDHSAISYPSVQKLLPENIFSIAIDFPGFGESDRSEKLNSRVGYSNIVSAACRLLNINSAVITGLSMGGHVALGVAAENPALVAGLVLVAPGGLSPDRFGSLIPALFSRIPFSHILLRRLSDNRSKTDKYLSRMFGNQEVVTNEFRYLVHKALNRDDSYKSVMEFARNQYKRLRQQPEFAGRLAEIACPVTLIAGENDVFFDPGDLRKAAEMMPNATYVLVPGGGHWLTVETPGVVAAEIARLVS